MAANAKAATAAGALWEHGCGKGRDEDLYRPLAVAASTRTPKPASSTAKSKYYCNTDEPVKFDPDNPHIIINRSCPDIIAEKQAQDDAYNRCVAKGYDWNTTHQRCNTASEQRAQSEAADESRAGQRDANGETYAEYCARTGQSLETCQAG